MKKAKYSVLFMVIVFSMVLSGVKPVYAQITPYIGILENAYTATIKDSGVVKGSLDSTADTIATIEFGQTVGVIDEVEGKDGKTWTKVIFKKSGKIYEGYFQNVSSKGTKYLGKYNYDSSFESKINAFPDSYKPYLRVLHSTYPSWNFYPLNTNLDFNTAATQFQKSALLDSNNRNLTIYSSSPLEGSTWYRAKLDTVKYYLDPRNYLTAYRALTFKKMTYSTDETESYAKYLLRKYSLLSKYTNTFYNASKSYQISLFNVVTRAISEQGSGGKGLTGDEASDGKTYYNVYNIGAYTGAQDGIEYAMRNGWDTVEKSIYGGISYLKSKYIDGGQWSSYLQRFNVNPKSTYSTYSHSYMLGLEAPLLEGKKIQEGYAGYSIPLDEKTQNLYIPIYKNMPSQRVNYPELSDNLKTMDLISMADINSYLEKWDYKNGNWYLYRGDYLIKNQWYLYKAKWYYFDNTGKMVKGWQYINNKWYYLGGNGEMRTGWLQSNNVYYYLTANGSMAKGWQKIGTKWYYFASTGKMLKGWQYINNTWYYLGGNGEMRTGWIQSNNAYYYLTSSGSMAKGWYKIGTKWHYFDNDGKMKKGWLKLGNSWYYLDNNGYMVTGKRYIGGKYYYFYSSGVMK